MSDQAWRERFGNAVPPDAPRQSLRRWAPPAADRDR
ncbi:hypothetical protein CBM2634_A180039 [Cupriavidus taiwanensis]|uniref:Uncharacterized protein n=1 Tax=Cupriavidus taiwanensis TaxID=164546 RepID=A0A375IYR6_9BURK|nr:hypothetical protein CBM2634_A180039 [Cupriavidus taiwanensis]